MNGIDVLTVGCVCVLLISLGLMIWAMIDDTCAATIRMNVGGDLGEC